MKEYASLDEVREVLHDECDFAFDDLLKDARHAGWRQAEALHFTIWITPELADQIRKLA